MSFSIKMSGSIAMQDTSGSQEEQVLAKDLAKIWPTLTGISEQNFVTLDLIDTDGVVNLTPIGISNIRGILLYIKSGGGTFTLKHNGNVNGITSGTFILIQGEMSAITVETADVQSKKLEYLLFQ